MPSGRAWSSAATVAPASILPSAGYCSATTSAPGPSRRAACGTPRPPTGRTRVRRHDRPALYPGELRPLDQHADLHRVARPDAEGVPVALRHGDGVAQRLGRDVDDLPLVCEVGERDPDVRQERSEQERDPLAADELVGDAGRVPGRGAVVARDDLELAPGDAALGVDLLKRQLPAVPVGHGEGRPAAVGVQLADPDWRLGRDLTRAAPRPGTAHARTIARTAIVAAAGGRRHIAVRLDISRSSPCAQPRGGRPGLPSHKNTRIGCARAPATACGGPSPGCA